MIEGNLALPIQNQPLQIVSSANNLKPCEQEIFESTPWKKGNTGITKRVNYNDKFEMFYRIVDTSKLLDKKKCLEKIHPETLYLCGGQDLPMGSPKGCDDPDPFSNLAGFENTKLSVFSELPSIQAARKTTNRLNIAYDCEYKRIAISEYRLITSYQFAVYLPDEKRVLEVIFKSLDNDIMNRLYLRTCIGAILDLLVDMGALNVVSAGYAITRRWNVNTIDSDNNVSKHTFNSLESALSFQSEMNESLVIVDKTAYKTNDFTEFKKKGIPLEIAIICHCGIVDLPAFKDDMFAFRKKQGSVIPYLNSMQGGLTSLYPYFITVPTAKEYWKFYPVNILFRDTMCCAPAEGKSLSVLGESLEVPKITLPEGAISSMDTYMKEFPEDYMAYAAQDALVTLMYGSRLWGINKDWPLTSTSGACFAMKDSIANYLSISRDNNGNINKEEFNRVFRGYKEVNKGKISTPAGLRQLKNTEATSYEVSQLHSFSSASYAGGINSCTIPGVFQNNHTYDDDLKNAYPTAMCLVFDIDYENPIEREFKNEELSLQAFRTPVDPLFCLVDFEFPKSVKYPCIAIHDDGSIVFPRCAEAVYASGPSLYLALKLGAKIHVRRGYMGRIKMTENLTPSMSLRVACKQMVNDREIAVKTYKKDSIEERLLKLFINGSYGKIAQDVIEKNTWDGWNEYMNDIGFSAITSPERAALITDIVRCMLIGTMNQLADNGKNTFSVTTDGFITDATLEEVNSVDCYGFRRLFEQARLWLTDNTDPTIWVVKHEQCTLINPTTRCNIGYDIPAGSKGVLAHGGISTIHSEYEYNTNKEYIEEYIGGIDIDDDFGGLHYKDSPNDRHRMAELILNRIHSILYISREFPNIKDLGPSGTMKDFNTFFKHHQVRLDFDLKRKPIRETICDVSGEIDGISYTHSVFDTEPFENIEEYQLYRAINKNITCLRTKADWDVFYLKMKDRELGYKRHTPDEWSKLVSVIQGYRFGLWSLPDVDACKNEDGSMNVKNAIDVINLHNHSTRTFNESAWKNARRPERASQMLPAEMIQDLLDEFKYIPTPNLICELENNSSSK